MYTFPASKVVPSFVYTPRETSDTSDTKFALAANDVHARGVASFAP